MGAKESIFIVEDEAITALDIADILQNLGYDVLGSEVSGEQALEKLENNRPNLVLMDINLKGEMDGIETAAKVWDLYKIPVVFLTAFGDEKTLSRAKLVHPFGYILKPFEDADLRAAVELALHRSKEENLTQPVKKAGEQNTELSFGSSALTPHSFLRRVDPFRQLEQGRLETFANGCTFRDIKEGERIIEQEQAIGDSFIVAKGRIALVKASASGKELTVDVLPPGDIFVVVLSIQGESSQYTARASVDSSVLTVPGSSLSLLLEDFPALYKEFTSYMTERVAKSHDFSRQLAHEKVEVRIAAALQSLLTDFAKVSDDDSYTIDMTRQQLADLTGTTPETAIRTTKAMERKGILNLETPGIIKIVDVESLEKLASNMG